MGTVHPIRVIVADDHPIIRFAIEAMIARDPHLTLVGSAADGAGALGLIDERLPDVAIIDGGMGNVDGADVAARCQNSDCRVLIFSAHEDPDTVHRCLAAGAAGYLTKAESLEHLREAVHAVGRGELVVTEQLRLAVLRRIGPDVAVRSEERPRLSARETAVVALAADGFTAAKIGQSLRISEGTVKTYFGRAYKKLGVHERSAAVASAIRHGLLD